MRLIVVPTLLPSRGSSSGESWKIPAVGAVALGQHSGVHQCSEHASACDLIEPESRLRSSPRQRQCRVLEIVGLDSHNEVFNSVTYRGHYVLLQEIGLLIGVKGRGVHAGENSGDG
jgi:hypothetical protein